jgi:hypothetical protein
MKFKIIAALALLIVVFELSSCANRQYPGRYHHGNNGQSRYY